MPKILRIINRFNLGGPTYNAAYLTKYLSPEFQTLLVGGINEETEENSEYIVKNLGIRPIVIPEMRRSINFTYDIIAYNKIKEIIRRFKPDIIHTHASKAGAIGRRAAAALKVPVIVHTFHGHIFDAYFGSIKSSFYQNIERNLAKITTKIIALSENQKKELIEKYKICENDKIEIIPLGFDLEKFHIDTEKKRKIFRKEYNIEQDEIAIGIIGRIVPIKNHELFVDAIKYVNENTNKKIRAFIIGDGEHRSEIEKRILNYNLQFSYGNNKSKTKTLFTFTSWQKEMDKVMAGLDIIALTSLNEGTPVSLIEAQAACKPIVTTEVGGIKDVVIENKTALLSPSNDLMSFANNLLLLIENDKLRANLGKDGWQHVMNKYHYKRLCNDMKNLYYQLLEKNK